MCDADSATAPLCMRDRTSPSRRSMRFCMSSGLESPWIWLFLRAAGEAYEQDVVLMPSRLVQLVQGWLRSHFLSQRQQWHGRGV